MLELWTESHAVDGSWIEDTKSFVFSFVNYLANLASMLEKYALPNRQNVTGLTKI